MALAASLFIANVVLEQSSAQTPAASARTSLTPPSAEQLRNLMKQGRSDEAKAEVERAVSGMGDAPTSLDEAAVWTEWLAASLFVGDELSAQKIMAGVREAALAKLDENIEYDAWSARLVYLYEVAAVGETRRGNGDAAQRASLNALFTMNNAAFVASRRQSVLRRGALMRLLADRGDLTSASGIAEGLVRDVGRDTFEDHDLAQLLLGISELLSTTRQWGAMTTQGPRSLAVAAHRLKINGDRCLVIWRVADAYFALGEYQNTIDVLSPCLNGLRQDQPDDVASLFNVARLSALASGKLGHTDEALLLLDRADALATVDPPRFKGYVNRNKLTRARLQAVTDASKSSELITSAAQYAMTNAPDARTKGYFALDAIRLANDLRLSRVARDLVTQMDSLIRPLMGSEPELEFEFSLARTATLIETNDLDVAEAQLTRAVHQLQGQPIYNLRLPVELALLEARLHRARGRSAAAGGIAAAALSNLILEEEERHDLTELNPNNQFAATADAAFLSLESTPCTTTYCLVLRGARAPCSNPDLQASWEDISDAATERTDVYDAAAAEEVVKRAILGEGRCKPQSAELLANLLLSLGDIYDNSELNVWAYNVWLAGWDNLLASGTDSPEAALNLAKKVASNISGTDRPEEEVLWRSRVVTLTDRRVASRHRYDEPRLALLRVDLAPYIDEMAIAAEVVDRLSQASLYDSLLTIKRLSPRLEAPGPAEFRTALRSITRAAAQRVQQAPLPDQPTSLIHEANDVFDTALARLLLKISPDTFDSLVGKVLTTCTGEAPPSSCGESKLLNSLRRALTVSLEANSASAQSAQARLGPMLSTLGERHPKQAGPVLALAARSAIANGNLDQASAHMAALAQLKNAAADWEKMQEPIVSDVIRRSLQEAAAGRPDSAAQTMQWALSQPQLSPTAVPLAALRLRTAQYVMASCQGKLSTPQEIIAPLSGMMNPAKGAYQTPYEHALALLSFLYSRGEIPPATQVADVLTQWEQERTEFHTEPMTYEIVRAKEAMYDSLAMLMIFGGKSAEAQAYVARSADVLDSEVDRSERLDIAVSPALRWQALLSLKQRRFAQAEASYRQIIRRIVASDGAAVNADEPFLMAVTGWLFAREGATTEAGHFLKSARKAAPKAMKYGREMREDMLAVLQANIYLSQGDPRKAIQVLRRPNEGQLEIGGMDTLIAQTLRPEILVQLLLPPTITLEKTFGANRLYRVRRELLLAAAEEASSRGQSSQASMDAALFAIQHLSSSGTARTAALRSVTMSANDPTSALAAQLGRERAAVEWSARRRGAEHANNWDLEPFAEICNGYGAASKAYAKWDSGRGNRDRDRDRLSASIREIVVDTAPESAAQAALNAPVDWSEIEKRLKLTPASFDQIRGRLADDAAVLLFHTTEQATYIQLIGRSRGPRLFRVSVSREKLDMLVDNLLAGIRPNDASGPALPPFPLNDAFELYSLLFDPLQEALAGIHEIVVTGSGPTMRIPLSLLVTQRPAATSGNLFEDYRTAAWMDQRFRVRAVAGLSIASEHSDPATTSSGVSFAGFGSPDIGTAKECSTRVAADLIDEPNVLGLCPIPGATELVQRLGREVNRRAGVEGRCDSARPGRPGGALCVTGSAFKESAVREAAANLRSDGIMIFASHGLLAEEVRAMNGLSESALVASPDFPESDGLLTLGEFAQLSLPARLVILTACNTSQPDIGDEVDAHSGLPQAFFMAGVQSVVISHWVIFNEPAMDLTELLLTDLLGGEGATPASALQAAMAKVRGSALETRPEEFSHPRFWAAFSVVDRQL
jgi:CHAT domain-containing protein/tetratricopeptide (TPR) repeat protein